MGDDTDEMFPTIPVGWSGESKLWLDGKTWRYSLTMHKDEPASQATPDPLREKLGALAERWESPEFTDYPIDASSAPAFFASKLRELLK